MHPCLPANASRRFGGIASETMGDEAAFTGHLSKHKKVLALKAAFWNARRIMERTRRSARERFAQMATPYRALAELGRVLRSRSICGLQPSAVYTSQRLLPDVSVRINSAL